MFRFFVDVYLLNDASKYLQVNFIFNVFFVQQTFLEMPVQKLSQSAFSLFLDFKRSE